MISLRSSVYQPVSVYGSGRVASIGISFSGSPLMLCVMRNQLGSSVSTGRTLIVTGLYFLPVYTASGVHTVGKLMVCVGVSKSIARVSEGKRL